MRQRLLFLGFCITILAGCKKESTKIKDDIVGTWYYKAYDVKYYDGNSNLFYDAVAANPGGYPALQFFDDGSLSYPAYLNGSASYEIKTSGGKDSLIILGEINGGSRFRIVSFSKSQIQLESNGGAGIVFNDQSQYANYAYSHSTSVLTRSR